jgi:hypothetical protein
MLFPWLADRVDVTDRITRYGALGYGWGNSVLALVAAIAGFGGPLTLWKYGAWLRSKSPFAAEGL